MRINLFGIIRGPEILSCGSYIAASVNEKASVPEAEVTND